jgi:hypothetical protein
VSKAKLCRLIPVKSNTLVVEGDIVLCEVDSKHHFAVVKNVLLNKFFLIGHNKGKFIGWTTKSRIFGKYQEEKSK